MPVKTAPYGTWDSPITSASLVENAAKIQDVVVDPITSVIYHLEGRPQEAGRSVLVNTEKGKDVVGEGWNFRTGVQEYGGAPAIAYDGVIYFSNFSDGRVYSLKEGHKPEVITPENAAHRFADFAVHPHLKHFIVAILEDHTKPAPADVVTTLCVIDTKSKTVSPLVSGADFYSSPTFSPDGSHLAWIQWSHPDMPWDGSEVHIARVNVDQTESKLSLTDSTHVAGRYKEISAGFPLWLSSDVLLFTSDESGYQNPWVYKLSNSKASPALKKPVPEDFSIPAWKLGTSTSAVTGNNEGKAIFSAIRDGRSVLYLLTLHSGALEEIPTPYVSVVQVRRVTDDNVVFIGAKTDEGKSIILCSLRDYAKPHFTTFKSPSTSADKEPPKAYFSVPQPYTITIEGEPVHVIYFPPTNPNYQAPETEKPPCVVDIHGGPTAQTDQQLDMMIQFFTSRGWAWLVVNYGGSSGYGRKYVDRLNKQWGIVDVRDATFAPIALSKPPYSLIDISRTAIRGGSAGGYTVLASLCAFPDAFAAGTSLYGISDLKKLGEFTHKFESKYLEKLIGGTYEEAPQIYKERSPITNADSIKSPLLIEQGSLDAVVPPEQAEDIVKRIKAKGGRVDYVVFEGEGHGWRKAENIKAALEKELAFYEDVFTIRK